MKRTEHSVELPLPIAEAFAEWERIELFPAFMRHVMRVTPRDDRRSYWELVVGGVEWEFEVVITGRDPGRSLAWSTVSGDIDFAGSVEFDEVDAVTTRARVLIEWRPVGLLEKVGAVFGDDGRVLREELEAFRVHLEAQTRQSRAATP